MNIGCGNCGRSFELDDKRVGERVAVLCLCGNRIAIKVDPNAPQRLGKYLLLNRIATGGMGEIYYGKVSGVEGFEKEVAIKKMLPHLSADRDFINMMVKEAKLTVLLSHPNVVGVYDLSKEGDEYYIAMEYVPGVTVGAILEQARRAERLLPWEVAVHITMQVLRGLGYAHNLPMPNGERIAILHRDITPQNILVTRHAFVKITDFGIAKAVNEISTTSPGMIKGKLGYIAPEQLEGSEPDQRVDLFCAGILLWEMLAVRRLFKGSSEVDTFRLISECKIPPMSNFRKDVPEAVEAIINRSLAREPSARYGRAEEFTTALNQAIAPRSADDFGEFCDKYFGAHPDFFTSIADHKGSRGDSAAAPVPVEQLDLVSQFVRQPEYRSRSSLWPTIMASTIILLLVGALVSLLFLRKSPLTAPSGLPTATRMETNTPVAPSSVVTVKPTWPIPLAPPAAVAPTPTAEPSAPGAHATGLGRPTAPQAKDGKPFKVGARHDKGRLTGADIQATVVHNQPAIARCMSTLDPTGAPPEVVASITITTEGGVSTVDLAPKLPQTLANQCLSRVLLSMRFARRPTSDVQVKIPLKITTIRSHD